MRNSSMIDFSELKKRFNDRNISLIAVSKKQSIEAIQAIYDQGQRLFGENYVQELVDKYQALPKNIEWHMIGHMQSNKVKYIAPFVTMIHGVDRWELVETIQKQAAKYNRSIDILLQIHIAQETSKFGMSILEAEDLLKHYLQHKTAYPNIRIRGLMGMASFTDDETQIQQEFKSLKTGFDYLKQGHMTFDSNFNILSAGMSGDYEIAIAEGSNMVRIGSLIFGERQ